MRRWSDARCLEMMVEDLRILLHEYAGRKGQPTAVVIDSHILNSMPLFCAHAGYDGAKRLKGTKVHVAVETLGSFQAPHVMAPDKHDRA